jgi:aspartokinase-like uncharacterized kinase
VVVCARQRDRVTGVNAATRHFIDRLISGASVGPSVHRTSSQEIKNTNQSHGCRPLQSIPRGARESLLVNIDLVVKVGGSVMKTPPHLDVVLREIARAVLHGHRLIVVPGGGQFADTVREAYRRFQLPDDVAHWMAVLAMDQYAHLLAARFDRGALVTELTEVRDALLESRVPVLAPARWLRMADPLPHTWSVTSDSIAAWIAGAVGARYLVLVKPPGLDVPAGPGSSAGRDASVGTIPESTVVDAYFSRALPPSVSAVIIPADHAPSQWQQLLDRIHSPE